MYSKNEFILDFKKKHKKTENFFFFFFKTFNQVNFFQKVETDQPASRVRIQPICNTHKPTSKTKLHNINMWCVPLAQ